MGQTRMNSFESQSPHTFPETCRKVLHEPCTRLDRRSGALYRNPGAANPGHSPLGTSKEVSFLQRIAQRSICDAAGSAAAARSTWHPA